MTRVLVVGEAEDGLSAAVETMSGLGFEVLASDLESSATRVVETKPDLLLLNLGDEESRVLKLCEAIRAQSHIPMMVVGIDHRWLVPALTAGADDYLPKPVDPPTLVAKTLALLRRAGYANEAKRALRVRDLAVDLDRCQVTLKGEPISLTPIEYRILAALTRRAGRVLTCAELLKEAQGYEVGEQEARDIIKVHVYHLRRKLEPGEAKGDYVRTVPGFGYMLERRSSTSPAQQGDWVKRGTVRQAPEPATG